MFLNMFLKNFDLGTCQLLKFSFTYSVKDLGVYDYFSRNYGQKYYKYSKLVIS